VRGNWVTVKIYLQIRCGQDRGDISNTVMVWFVCVFVQYDVREDEEQDVKLKESINLLLAAGYFRARIKGLTPFDKVHTRHVHTHTYTH